MMSVYELIKNPIYNKKILIEGCIVIIEQKLYLIDSSTINDFPNLEKIRINNNIKSILLKSVALYSGVTALFHDVRIIGYVLDDGLDNNLSIDICELHIKDGNEWKYIDINIVVNDNVIEVNNEVDWNDLFK